MGIMEFDSKPIGEVRAFIEKNYRGGTIIDYGCGCGRYTDMFPKDKYLGVDGHKGNIENCKKKYPGYKFELHDLETWKPKQYDCLFSSVVFDQIENLPKDWAKHYILIENEKYKEIFKPQIDEPLGTEGTRMMIC